VVFRPAESGIYNLGTGRAQPFNDIAITVVNTLREQRGESPLSLEQAVTGGLIEYIAFPDALRGKYQSYTQANLSALRRTGCDHVFADVQSGVRAYVQALSAAR
jgi:ADP-L-glycero-D-manno-heptose 6-epimerase